VECQIAALSLPPADGLLDQLSLNRTKNSSPSEYYISPYQCDTVEQSRADRELRLGSSSDGGIDLCDISSY